MANSVKVSKVEKLLEDRLLIQPDEAVKVTHGGIILPDGAVEKPRKGTVIAVGPGKRSEGESGKRHPMTVAVGDRVLYTAHSGQFGGGGGNVEIEGYEGLLVLMYESEVICTIGG